MNKTRIGLLVAALLCAFPASSAAQKRGDARKAPPAQQEAATEAAEAEGAAGDTAEAVGADAPIEEGVGGDVPGGEGLEDICKLDPAACPQLNMEQEAARPINEDIYAVQQVFALRARRFELQPYWSFSLNDQYVSHPAPGLALNYYITNVLAVGLNGNYYRPFGQNLKRVKEFNVQVRRAARVGVPLTEYDWSAALNFTYVPAYGKFAGFGDFIFHYDAYVVGGVGVISTRPIPVIDPEYRTFDFERRLSFNAGLGLRIFFNRWFAATAEVRDYIFNDELENVNVGTTPEARRRKDDWTDETRLTNNVQVQVGVSIFFPFSFDYRLPK